MPSVRLLSLLVLVTSTALAPSAHADGVAAPAPPAVDLARFERAGGRAIRSNGVPQGKVERYGHAEILVAAPLAAVRQQVTAYNGYRDLAPDKFSRSRVIAKENGETDVYMQAPLLKGLIVLWQVMRFSPVRALGPDSERVEGRYVRGNLKDANVIFTMKSVDARRTLLTIDLLVLPNMAVPQSMVDEELRDAAAIAVEAMREKAEGRGTPGAVASSSR